MKKKLFILLTIILSLSISLFTLTACGGDDGDGSGNGDGGGHVCEFVNISTVNATCSEEGYFKKSCSCGEFIKEGAIPKTHHALDQNGVCSVCSATASDIRITKISGKNEYSVKGVGSFTGTEIVIPSTVNGMPVTEINSSAFKNKTNIERIDIPASVKVIGKQAFSGCTSLRSISLSDENSIESVGESAFSNCDSLLTNSSNGGEYVGNAVLLKPTDNATSVSISETCKFIYEKAFNNNLTVTELTIPSSVKNLGESAFYKCSNLAKVNYGGSIDDWATLSFVDMYSTPCYYGAGLYIDGNLVTTPVINANEISDYAFAGCHIFDSVEINSANVGEFAFYNCAGLITLNLGEKVEFIGTKAFELCNKIIEIKNDSSILIEMGVESAENSNVGVNARNIYSSKSGASKIVEDANQNICMSDEKEVYLFGCKNPAKHYVVPENVTYIGEYAFYKDTVIESVDFGSTVKTIGDYSFSGSALKSVEIPANVTYIGARAFQDAKNVETVNFATEGSKLKSFGEYAFADLPLVTSIYLPDGLEIMGDYSFENCTSLVDFSMPASLKRLAYRILNGCMEIKIAKFRGTGFMKLTMQPVEGHPNELYFFFWYYLSGLEWCETYGGMWQVEPYGR